MAGAARWLGRLVLTSAMLFAVVGCAEIAPAAPQTPPRWVIRNTPVPVFAGGLPLILATIGFTFFGEALRDALDPKLQGKRMP